MRVCTMGLGLQRRTRLTWSSSPTLWRSTGEDLPTLIWKDTPPQHFEYERGYFW